MKTQIYKLHFGKTISERYVLKMDYDKLKASNDELIKTAVERFIHEFVQTDADVTVNDGEVDVKFRYEDFEWFIAPESNNINIVLLVVCKMVDGVSFEGESEINIR